VTLLDLPAHLFALALVTLVPLTSAAALRALMNGGRLRVPRRDLYRDVVVSQWILAVLSLAVLAPTTNPVAATGMVAGAGAGMVAVVLLVSTAVAVELAHIRPRLPLREPGDALGRVAFLLPRSRPERLWWIALSTTAGVCEEIVFRGFLLHYLLTYAPGIGISGAIILSSVIFGLGHLYQGPLSAGLTAAVGAVLAVSYLATGSLWVPIVLHAALDLRVLWICLPPDSGTSGEVASEVP